MTDLQAVKSDIYDKDYFLESCEGHEHFSLSGGLELSPRMRRALELAGIVADMRVLDMGAGRGEILLHSALAGASAVGIDYSAAAVEIAHKCISAMKGFPEGKIEILKADARAMPFPDASFDVVLMLDIIEHLYPEQSDAALSEAWRVLKPGGRLVIHTAPNALVHRFAYPVYRAFRGLVNGDLLPRTLDEFNPVNTRVHVNKQTTWSLKGSLQKKFRKTRVWLEDPDPATALLNPAEKECRRWVRAALTLARCRYPLKVFCCNHIFGVAEK